MKAMPEPDPSLDSGGALAAALATHFTARIVPLIERGKRLRWSGFIVHPATHERRSFRGVEIRTG